MGRTADEWQCTPLNCGTGSFHLHYTYDLLGDLATLVNYAEGSGVTYTYNYDTAGRLSKMLSSANDANHPGTLLTVNQYNSLGFVQQATLGNGVLRTLQYDTRGRLTSLTDGSLYSFTLGYALDSSITSGNDGVNGNWTYGYDDIARLASANKNNGQQTFSYKYDRYGNRWQQNAPQGGPAPQYTFDANNHITSSGVIYDAAGNITNDGLGNTYTYDAEHRVISVAGANSATYTYDAMGKRVRATVNGVARDFVFDQGARVITQMSPGWARSELYAAGLHVATYTNSTTYFDHSDWLGTVRVRSSVSGGTVESCSSLSFGDSLSCTGTDPSPLHFTGSDLDSESGLTHTLFRQLSTVEGRWTVPDPAGMGAVSMANPQTWNRYAYVGNMPLTNVDPLGLQQWHPDVNAPTDPNAVVVMFGVDKFDLAALGLLEVGPGGFCPAQFTGCQQLQRGMLGTRLDGTQSQFIFGEVIPGQNGDSYVSRLEVSSTSTASISENNGTKQHFVNKQQCLFAAYQAEVKAETKWETSHPFHPLDLPSSIQAGIGGGISFGIVTIVRGGTLVAGLSSAGTGTLIGLGADFLYNRAIWEQARDKAFAQIARKYSNPSGCYNKQDPSF